MLSPVPRAGYGLTPLCPQIRSRVRRTWARQRFVGRASITPRTLHFLAGLVISFLTFVASARGTTSTILLGWRADRRQSEEFKLKLKQLELQLQEAKAKVMSPAKDT
jgi:hypothetical protein